MDYDTYDLDRRPCVVLTTAPDEAVAADLARMLVEQRLAACVTRFSGAISLYRWQGKVAEEVEVQLLVKTTRSRLAEVTSALAACHPYDEPEVIVLDAAGGSPGYLGWIEEETTEAVE
ncbi:MAG: divalent-cation tolerance protein CutA [Gammaproteobacteria bacterium]